METNQTGLRTNQAFNHPLKEEKLFSTANLIKMALLSAIAAILMQLGIKLPALFPSFLEIDFSEVPAIVAVLTMNPLAGIVVVVMKNILKIILFGTNTMYVGELANLLVSIGYMLPLILLVRKGRGFKRVIIGICLGTLGLTLAGAVVNYFITLPFYAKVMIPMDAIVGMGNSIYSGITDKFTLILFSFVPFNLLKGALVSIVSIVFVKSIYPLLGVLRTKRA
jgi:riboflavin transporter FmnP